MNSKLPVCLGLSVCVWWVALLGLLYSTLSLCDSKADTKLSTIEV